MSKFEEEFHIHFDRFKQDVFSASDGIAFKSFHEGLPADWESYKPKLRSRALDIMDADNWLTDQVGSGDILRNVINAIQINDGIHGVRNNLVRWENRWGYANRSHHKLLDAIGDTGVQTQWERVFLDFYQGHSNEPEAFEKLRALAGNRYDLISYLFFLRDAERFMPLAPTTFDHAFRLLSLDLVTARKCSWDNYALYNDALSKVQHMLREVSGITDTRLIDAHSFCWMLVRLPKQASTNTSPKPKLKNDPGKVLDAREKSVWEMVNSVKQTVKAAVGPGVEKVPKLKELRMSEQQLKNHIKQLLEKQEDRCALTGIQIQFNGEHTDDQLLPSLDRIDSDGHYEEGNLQVVCRFINFWKGASDDEEFRRLLSLVRGEED